MLRIIEVPPSLPVKPIVRLRNDRNQRAIIRRCLEALGFAAGVTPATIERFAFEADEANGYDELLAVCSRFCELR